MIPRIQSPGGSFAGAGKYYLHDKLNEQQAEAAKSGERLSTRGQSDERVWFTTPIPSARWKKCGTRRKIRRG